MSIGSQIRALQPLQIEQQPRKKLLHGCIRPMGVPSNGLKLLCRPHSANAAAAVGDKSVLEKATTGQTLDTGHWMLLEQWQLIWPWIPSSLSATPN